MRCGEPTPSRGGRTRRRICITSVCDSVRRMSATAQATYPRSASGIPSVGPRVRALREAMGLSLRDLAERSGVSAPMLSQVERGETSPTLAVAAKIAAGLELTLSQLLRLDEGEHVVDQPRRRAAPLRARRPPLRGADAAAARPARRRLAAHAGRRRRHRRPRRPADARAGQPRDRRRPRRRRWRSSSTATATSCASGDSVTFDADLPHHFENEGEEPTRFLAVIAAGLRRSIAMPQDDVRQDLGGPRGRRRPDLHRPAPRPRGHLAAGLRRAAAGRPRACAGPTRRSPPPTTTCRPTARWPRA